MFFYRQPNKKRKINCNAINLINIVLYICLSIVQNRLLFWKSTKTLREIVWSLVDGALRKKKDGTS